MRLVLWDVDGTLVDSAGYGRIAFAEAFERLFGRPPKGNVPMPGRTDHEIVTALLELNAIAEGDAHLPRIWEELARALAKRRADIAAEGFVQPGAREALEALARRDGVLQSLLTGNIEPNAAVKLAAFGLEEHVDLEIGAFGSHRGARSALVAIACARASAKHGIDLRPPDAVVIGDTPLDVVAAREGGARAVAVATGPYGEAVLRKSGPDAVLPDLSDVGAVLTAIGP
jgi:phosphoglycolate phosphatase